MATPLHRPDPEAGAAERYVRGMERLVRVVQELSLARDLATIQRIVRTAARELTGADGATFVLRDNGKCHYADEDAIAPLWKGMRFPMEICISGWAMLNRRSTVIPDIYQDPRIPADAYRPTFVKSLAMVPIRTLDPIGAIGNYWARLHTPTAQDVELLQTLADTTAVAMENVRIYEELEQRVRDRTAELLRANEEIRTISLTDELTGLHNRRGFTLFAGQALKLARRTGQRAMLIFIDADGLKPVNDVQGHEAGDAMLQDIGRALRAAFRDSDVVARLGGDEFGVLAIDAGDSSFIRPLIETRLQQLGERPYPLEVSLGVVEVNGEDSLDDVIERADKAMYLEKRARKAARR